MFKTSAECELRLITHSNCDDLMPVRAARVSFGKHDITGNDVDRDNKLLKYLAQHQHLTPFEYQTTTFLIECPLFIRSQIHRHRAFSYNEISRRYTDENLEFWIPDQLRGQAKSNKQASDGVITEYASPWQFMSWQEDWDAQTADSLKLYRSMVEQGVAREQARAVLPQSLLTKFYMGGNLRSWAHFIELRRNEHAQYEVQIIAGRIAAKLKELWPESCDALGI